MPTLVSRLGPGPVDCLLDGVGGQDSVDHRDRGFSTDPGQAVGHHGGQNVEVRRLPADESTERDHRVELSASDQPAHDRGNLPGTGHAVDAQRIYLTGNSMGGYGTWSLAMAYPQLFAAIAPICGGAGVLVVVGSST